MKKYNEDSRISSITKNSIIQSIELFNMLGIKALEQIEKVNKDVFVVQAKNLLTGMDLVKKKLMKIFTLKI